LSNWRPDRHGAAAVGLRLRGRTWRGSRDSNATYRRAEANSGATGGGREHANRRRADSSTDECGGQSLGKYWQGAVRGRDVADVQPIVKRRQA
jgi:hypothetical protein